MLTDAQYRSLKVILANGGVTPDQIHMGRMDGKRRGTSVNTRVFRRLCEMGLIEIQSYPYRPILKPNGLRKHISRTEKLARLDPTSKATFHISYVNVAGCVAVNDYEAAHA